ncbi:MAG: PAS domain S-box protein [Verrucomicrobia bacterium]|nr:PAS domain S-box protein [Verrucomicrobiota bacterium]
MPRRTWLERASLTLAGALVCIGLVTALGWWMGIDELVQPFPAKAPTKINEALCFVVIGAVLVALEYGYRRVAWVTLIAAAVGAATFAEISLHRDFRIDEMLGRDHLLVMTEQPGRMAAVVAIALACAALALAWRACDWGARARLFVEAVAGSVFASAGFSTLLGYAAGLETVYSWGTLTATPPVSAVALLLLGLSLTTLAWRETMKAEGGPPAWSPMPAAIFCLTLTVILWIGLSAREHDFTKQNSMNDLGLLATAIDNEIETQTNQTEKIARRWAKPKEDSTELWTADAIEHLGDRTRTDASGTGNARERGCVSLAFVNAQRRTIWIYPQEGNEGAINFNHQVEPRRTALDTAQKLQTPVVTASVSIHGNQRGAVIYAPIVREDKVIGFVAAEFAYEPLVRYVIGAKKLEATYNISVAVAGEPVLTLAADSVRREDLTVNKTIPNLQNRRVQLSLTPTREALTRSRSWMPEVALIAGFFITVFLGLSVHLFRSARAGQRAAELSNKRLFGENEERRRVEARLKVSDERLRLALDSTQIGIFEWSVSAGHVYYSPGLWAMLGYEHGRMPSTVEAWQSLIHPEDLPLYRRRTESQLNGIATFIEPEYRVRARSGDWRWVYTRSKSVASGHDGRPTRIIGTVQDITARREAELALRESQAEARKLSLVASKTDNPVLIGSPDGRIEWANEAFCRVMEYSLGEVIGKNPAHFMIGPETSVRTVARIRAAMSRGQGISTDVVNYSKSGRKYHLHLEIQPVRGANGEVENFIAVETDITARVETETQLRRAKQEADEASRAKSEFLASMSHEIRTPMNGVIGMTSLLQETTLSGEQRDYVNTIRTSGEALLTIINDILDFSKIESGKMELERSPFELALCIEEALDLFSLQASAKKIDLAYYCEPDVPAWIVGDVTRLRQVIVNLVNNAVKFTPRGGISLEVRRAHREKAPLGFDPGLPEDPARVILEFTVRDTGIGIPPDRVDRLFKAFSQVDSSTTRKYGGTGLGLAICQRLTQLMGGAIRVESTPGQGSAFIFTIQTEPAQLTADSGLPPLPEPLRTGTVLCVERNAVNQLRLRLFFEKWGARVAVAADAAGVLPTVAGLDRPPALLVVDGGELEGPSPLDVLGRLACPRLVMYPFGQTTPAAPPDRQLFATTTKPLRTSALVQSVTGLFTASQAAAETAARTAERPLAEEYPLDVLLAEDNVVNQKVALRFLERLGYRAQAVANGLEAFIAVRDRRYDLVLMDLQMPEMDGLEASRQIRRDLPVELQPKIIALTANAMQGDREACLAAGMDDYISKPVKMHEIAAAIRRQFGKPAAAASQRVIG